MRALCVVAAATLVAPPQDPPASRPIPTGSFPTRGPDMDPGKFVARPFSLPPMVVRTFDSLASAAFAISDVWLTTTDEKAAKAELSYMYPDFYTPTWGEVLDHVARQMKCAWSWDPEVRQFLFVPSKDAPFFEVTPATGWSREDRGLYLWYAPKGQDFGLDVYYQGHFTAKPGDLDLHAKVRAHFARAPAAEWPNWPNEAQMKRVKVGGADALHVKTDAPRPNTTWLQWSFLVDGHAFVIVSAMPKDKEAQLRPAVEKMVASFKATPPPASRPARR